MIFKGHKQSLKLEDMWALDRNNKTSFILTKFNKVWIPTVEKEKKNAIKKASEGEPVITKISILGSLLKTFWSGFLFVALLELMACCLVFVNPLILDKLISFMNPSNDEPQWRGYIYASLMFISPLFESLLNNHYEYQINLISMRTRACLQSVIYEKVCYLLL
jgi:ATP-binding cassette subfamily C (CFTR/MRP) protein 1